MKNRIETANLSHACWRTRQKGHKQPNADKNEMETLSDSYWLHAKNESDCNAVAWTISLVDRLIDRPRWTLYKSEM